MAEIPNGAGELQCCSLLRDGKTRCPNWGPPADGFDFYACEGCLDYLGELLDAEGDRRNARHANN